MLEYRKKNEFYIDSDFGEIPKGWTLKRFIKCFDFYPTASYSRENLSNVGDCSYIHYGDIHTKFDGFLDFQKEKLPFVSEKMASRYTKIKDGDLIIADASEDYEGVGKAVEVFNLENITAIAGLHTLHLRAIDDCLINGFKGYVLNNGKVRNKILRSATGIKVYSVSKSSLKNILIPIPPPDEQRTIASILSKVDAAIAATKNSIAKAERLKKSLMQNLLTGKLKPDGTWRKEDEFQETIYGLVAKDWRYCKIQELIKDGMITDVHDGNHGESHPVSAEFVNEGIPFIMASDISSGFIDFTSCKFITFERAEKLRIGFSIKDDVLLSHKASMGFTAIVPDVDPYIMLTPQVTYYRCNKEKLLPEYLHFFFQSYKFQKLFETYSAQTTRNFMGITNQKKLYIFLPNTIEEQEEIIKPIKEVDKTLASKYVKIKKLERLKKALMQNLLTGKVRVKAPKEQLRTETK